MHYNTLFQDRNLKHFLGRGTASRQTPPTGKGEIPPHGRPHPTSSAPTRPQSSRLRRSTPRAFGAQFYASRIFSADFWQP